MVLLATCTALAAYLVHLKRLSDLQQQRLGRFTPVPAPPEAGTGLATLVMADDRCGRLYGHDTGLPTGDAGDRIREELRALFAFYESPESRHAFGRSADVRTVYVLDGDRVVIDANAALADSHPNDAQIEAMTVESIVRTVVANHPSIKRVKILIDGHERATLAGHVSLRDFFVASSQFKVRGPQ